MCAALFFRPVAHLGSGMETEAKDIPQNSEEAIVETEENSSPLSQSLKYQKGYNLQGAVQNTVDRGMPDVPLPVANLPTDDEFWISPGVPNVAYIQEHLRREGVPNPLVFYLRLGKFQHSHLIDLFQAAFDIFSEEANIISLPSPVTVWYFFLLFILWCY
jgi:hypothetical protein